MEIIKRKPTNTEYRLFKSMIKKGKTKSWVIDNINNINNPIKKNNKPKNIKNNNKNDNKINNKNDNKNNNKIDYKNVDKYIINNFKQIIKRKPTNTEFMLFKNMIKKKGKNNDWVIKKLHDIKNNK